MIDLSSDSFRRVLTTAKHFRPPQTRVAISTLVDVLGTTTSLQSLDLRYWGAYDTEDHASLAAALVQNRYITSLNLDGSYLGEDTIELLMDLLAVSKTLKHANFSHNALGGNHDSLALALASNHSLTSLELRSSEIGREHFDRLSQTISRHSARTSVNLQDLRCPYFEAAPDTQILRFSTSLRYLSLRNCSIGIIEHEIIGGALNRSLALTELDLGQFGTQKPATDLVVPLTSFLTSTTSLRALNLCGYSGYTVSFFEAVNGASSLRTLHFDHQVCYFAEQLDPYDHLRAHRGLSTLIFKSLQPPTLAILLSSMPSLTELAVAYLASDTIDCSEAFEALGRSKTLAAFRLGSSFSMCSASAFAAALKSNCSLRDLEFGIGGVLLPLDSIRELFDSLCEPSCALRKLTIHPACLGERRKGQYYALSTGAQKLIQRNRSIVSLSLPPLRSHEVSTALFVSAIAQNPVLQNLKLQTNDGTFVFREFSPVNQHRGPDSYWS